MVPEKTPKKLNYYHHMKQKYAKNKAKVGKPSILPGAITIMRQEENSPL